MVSGRGLPFVVLLPEEVPLSSCIRDRIRKILMQWFMDGLAGKRVVLSGCGGGCDVLGTSIIYQQIRGKAETRPCLIIGFLREGGL